ncbi:MAG: DUF4139 domain-containing protein [Candidatus Marinimicrobia bacterium]|nr:DUF4139 domain-containing protein [Candidatus Neomarinimicrobiota bacterium]MBT4361038.1 DUF4139 domain-containing protein [Candidatus Neomarinimicrobiota bacterium]MBT4715570.1 DUF4139 domain-containing protein [Candidatus Neomarinimicrobiota bacterium]MBT4946791.1 DUF4139 domain-containing protein [Candidatus Neomarinimicrobiota bacterium]MBT5269753.1 DUF4139 domain-containing protein [Candidatus Neomarinimicrobiota bacterium]
MRRHMKTLSLLLLITSVTYTQTQLTVYNHGEALVKEQFSRQIQRGVSEIEIERVAETLNPSSVKLGSDQDVQVLEQNYRYDLVNQNKLLKKYLEANVTVILQNDNKISGILLSYDNSTLVLKSRTGTDIIQRQFVGTIKCPTPTERLYVRPTLAWTLHAEKTGKVNFDLSYLTGGISWKAEYVAVVNQDDSELDLSSWINLSNQSGKDYNEAKLKLVAGDLHRARPTQAAGSRREKDRAFSMRAMDVVQERQFFEYHLYDISFPVSVHNREEKQIQWLNPTLVKAQKRYVYQGTRDQFTNIPIKIMFTNDKETGTGVALPGGVVRLFKKDTDGALELIGEDNLKHTSRDDLVTLEVGEAFDVKGKREVLDRRSKQDRYHEQDIRITLANRKDDAVEVEVIQAVGYRNWKVQNASHAFTKVDASRVKFTVAVPANKEVVLTYTSRVNLK